ncbi:hypothetical protein PFISCL1PPCAC_16714, partial [Pristionchus fissidentatus]
LTQFAFSSMPTYKLTYFDLRAGRGESCRVLFALGGVAYEDARVSREQWPEIAPCYAGPDNLTSALADALCDQYADFLQLWIGWFRVKFGFAEGNETELYEKLFVPARDKNFAFFEEALKKSTTGWLVSTPDLIWRGPPSKHPARYKSSCIPPAKTCLCVNM